MFIDKRCSFIHSTAQSVFAHQFQQQQLRRRRRRWRLISVGRSCRAVWQKKGNSKNGERAHRTARSIVKLILLAIFSGHFMAPRNGWEWTRTIKVVKSIHFMRSFYRFTHTTTKGERFSNANMWNPWGSEQKWQLAKRKSRKQSRFTAVDRKLPQCDAVDVCVDLCWWSKQAHIRARWSMMRRRVLCQSQCALRRSDRKRHKN